MHKQGLYFQTTYCLDGTTSSRGTWSDRALTFVIGHQTRHTTRRVLLRRIGLEPDAFLIIRLAPPRDPEDI